MSTPALLDVPVTWLPGTSARVETAQLVVSNGVARVFAHHGVPTAQMDDAQSAAVARTLLAAAPVRSLVTSTRMGSVPYRITFPDGGVAVADDHKGVETALNVPTAQGWLAKLEANPVAVVIAMASLLAIVGFAFVKGIPAFAEFAAQRVPRSAEQKLGEYALQGLDNFMFVKSFLTEKQKAPHIETFKKLAKAAGLENEVNLQFRFLAPNALALPGGTIVLTDGLVQVMKGEERLVGAVLAHELGHIHHRHSLRQIIQGSASALLVSVVAGDVSGMSGLVTSAPIVLSTLSYTRDGEREADEYAFDLLRKVGYSPNDFADAMARFEVMEKCLRLREQDREDAQEKGTPSSEWPDALQDDASDTHVEDKRKTAKSPRKDRAAICYTDPDGYIKGREAEVEALFAGEERKTGYLHTHPVTNERIDAARSAAKK
jgi:Zn-dependent protease with chaperone function